VTTLLDKISGWVWVSVWSAKAKHL
jgi:hypothetical protein